MKFVKQMTKLYLIQTILYFITKLIEKNPVFLTSKIDNMIPFKSIFVYFYISWFALMILVPYILYKNDKEKYNKYRSKLLLCYIISDFIFLLFPTTIVRGNFNINSLSTSLVNMIYYFDTPAYNCFPSIHCILSFLYIYSTINTKISNKYKCLIIITSIMIVLSTLFIKQHVLYDVISGLFISFIWFIPTSKIDKKILKILD